MVETEMTAGIDYGNGRISSLFAKMFFPTLLGLMFNALLTIIDGIFVGQGVGPDGIAAVNIVAPLFMVTTGTGLMFGIGSSVVAGIAMSRGDQMRACRNFTQGTMMAALVVCVLIAVCMLWSEGVVRALGCSDALLSGALDYMLWLLPGFLFLMFQCIGMMVIRLDGSPKYAMYCNIIPSLINIALDYYLVFPCGMGVKGAAIATSASVTVGALMELGYFLFFSYVIKFRFTLKKLFSNCWRQVQIGASAFITEMAMSVMMLTGNYVFMEYYGDAGVAAFSIACYLFPLMFMMSNAVAQSAQPIISYNYGAEQTDRVHEAFALSVKVAALCGFIAFLLIACCARQVVSMFIPATSEAGRLAVFGLPIYAVSAVFFAVNISFIGYYQSVEQGLRAMVLTLMRGVIVLVPMFVVLPRIFPDWGIWAAIPASEIVTLCLILLSPLVSKKV